LAKIWEKMLAAKHKAEAAYPLQSHEHPSEERTMAIFAAMVYAAIEGDDKEPAHADDDTSKSKGKR
jgi:hypothetical protein